MPNMKFSDYSNTITPPDLSIMLFENEGASNSFNTTFAQLKAAVAPTVSLGGVVFGGVGGALSVDTSNLVWNNTTKQMGIGAPINLSPPPAQFPLADFHIKKQDASLVVENSIATFTASIRAKSEVLGDAVVAAHRYSNGHNGYFELQTFIGPSPDWFIGYFEDPFGLTDNLSFKSSTQGIAGDPILTLTRTGSVGINTGNNAPQGGLQIGGTKGLVVGFSPLGGDKGGGTINANNIFIRNVQGPMRNSTRPTGAAESETTATDYIININTTPAPRTVTLSTVSLIRGNQFEWVPIIVADTSGGAGTNNILIDTEGGSLIDGVGSKSITTNYGSITFYADGANWHTV